MRIIVGWFRRLLEQATFRITGSSWPSSPGWMYAYGASSSAGLAAIPLLLVPSHPIVSGLTLVSIFLVPLTAGAVVAVRRHGSGPALRSDFEREARELATSITDLLADSRPIEPHDSILLRLDPGASEEEKSDAFWKDAEQSSASNRQIISRYQSRFGGRALALYREAVAAGLADGRAESQFVYPVNRLVLAKIAGDLGALAERARLD